MQAVPALLPTGESECTGQLSQLAFPPLALYLPVMHCVHVPPLGPEKPGLQAQSLMSLRALRESELDGHSMQEELPWVGLNVPEGQGAHAPPLTPE